MYEVVGEEFVEDYFQKVTQCTDNYIKAKEEEENNPREERYLGMVETSVAWGLYDMLSWWGISAKSVRKIRYDYRDEKAVVEITIRNEQLRTEESKLKLETDVMKVSVNERNRKMVIHIELYPWVVDYGRMSDSFTTEPTENPVVAVFNYLIPIFLVPKGDN